MRILPPFRWSRRSVRWHLSGPSDPLVVGVWAHRCVLPSPGWIVGGPRPMRPPPRPPRYEQGLVARMTSMIRTFIGVEPVFRPIRAQCSFGKCHYPKQFHQRIAPGPGSLIVTPRVNALVSACQSDHRKLTIEPRILSVKNRMPFLEHDCNLGRARRPCVAGAQIEGRPSPSQSC